MNHNVGREDRVIRACLALSLLLMGGFGVAATGGVNVAVIVFAVLGGYFVVTAIVGWDPLYARLRVSTRPDASDPGWDTTPVWDTAVPAAEPEAVVDLVPGMPAVPGMAAEPPVEIDLRDQRVPRRNPRGRADEA